MKKLLTSLIAIIMVVTACLVIFAACNGTTVDGDHTIIFYSSQGTNLQEVTKKAIDAFEAKYPGWKVEHTGVGGYDDVLSNVRQELLGGTQPDLAYCYPDHIAQYLKSQKVVDLNKYLKNSESYTTDSGLKIDRIGFTDDEVDKQFIKTYMEEGYSRNFSGVPSYYDQQNALFCLPFSKSTEVMYYNKDALDKLGLSVADKHYERKDFCDLLAEFYILLFLAFAKLDKTGSNDYLGTLKLRYRSDCGFGTDGVRII